MAREITPKAYLFTMEFWPQMTLVCPEIHMLTPLSALPAAPGADLSPWVRRICIALIALALASPAMAEKGKLLERLTPGVMAVVYPGAER